MFKKLASGAAVVALGLGGVFFSAGTASARVPCGQYYTTNSAYYNHCGSSSVVVYIKRYVVGESPETEGKCLPPGKTYIGLNYDGNYSTGSVMSARSDGDPC